VGEWGKYERGRLSVELKKVAHKNDPSPPLSLLVSL